MKAKEIIVSPKVLRYTFLALTAGGCLMLFLNLSSYFGITSDGPFIRGYVSTQGDYGPTVQPLSDGNGSYKIFNFGERKLVLLDFSNLPSFMQFRHMFYVLCQKMVWFLAIIVMYQMYRIFRNLDRKVMFRDENTRRIRLIALAVLLYPIMGFLAEVQFKAIVSQLPGHTLQLSSIPILDQEIVYGAILSLVIFALADVFRSGTQLQQEQDLTI